MAKRLVEQGDIYLCDLSRDSRDNEQKGLRPVLIISANIRNSTSNNVFIFPLTHANKKYQPCHYILLKSNYDFFTHNKQIVLCEEGRSISKTRLQKYLGTISNIDIMNILQCKEYIFIEKKGE